MTDRKVDHWAAAGGLVAIAILVTVFLTSRPEAKSLVEEQSPPPQVAGNTTCWGGADAERVLCNGVWYRREK